MPTVYITNRGYHDYSSAERHGELVDVTAGREDIFHTDRLAAKIQNNLEHITGEDYLLLSGSPLIAALCTGYVMKKLGKVRFLFWDGLKQDYVHRETAFDENARIES